MSRARPPMGLAVAGVVLGLLFLAPLGFLLWRTATSDADVAALLTSRASLDPLRRTAWLASWVALGASVVGTLVAWLVTRTDVPLRRVWAVLAPLPLVFPSFVGAAALLRAVAPGGLLDDWVGFLDAGDLPRLEGFWGSWLVLVLFTYPYVSLPVAARLRSLPPSLEESARLLGRRPRQVFVDIVLPQISGAVWAGTLLVFLYTMSDFGVVSLMRYDTLTRVIYENRLANQPKAFTLAALLGLLAIGVVVLERAVNRRRAAVEVRRGRAALHVPLGRWRWPAFGALVVVVGNALVGPSLSLVHWVWTGLDRTDGALAALGAELGDLAAPAQRTATVSVAAAVLTVALVLPVAYLTTRYRSRAGGLANALVMSGFALPGVAVALAALFWALTAPGGELLLDTVPLLLAAYAVHFGAQALRAAQVAVGGVPTRLVDAARMLGAGRARRLVTVEVPLMVPGLLAGGGLVLLSVMKELPVTLLVAPIGFDTLATSIWQSAEEAFFAEAGLASLVLVAVSGVLTWLLVVRRADAFD